MRTQWCIVSKDRESGEWHVTYVFHTSRGYNGALVLVADRFDWALAWACRQADLHDQVRLGAWRKITAVGVAQVPPGKDLGSDSP